MGVLTNLSLFSGAGGLDLGARLVGGIKTVGYVEYDRYAQGVLMSRIRDGGLDNAPIWDDVTTFDARPWRGKVDIVSGGFPCQPHSVAGKRGGAGDKRNLWPDYLRIVRECRPTFVLGENVFGILSNGFAVEVMASLEEIGYCVTPVRINACEVGAPHTRKRVFFIAHANGIRFNRVEENSKERLPDDIRKSFKARCHNQGDLLLSMATDFSNENQGVLRIDDGPPEELDRIRLCGNIVVPQQSAPAWQVIVDMARNIEASQKV